MNSLELKSYAKINIALHITGKREDGYHLLEMINDEISIYDILRFKKSQEKAVSLLDNTGFKAEENIVYKLAEYMFKRFCLPGGLEIELEKNIPVGAGLGGGSSNCATTIKAINALYDLKLGNKEMAEIGILFGADVPYCIYGGAALVSGIGENIEPFHYNPFFKLLIVKPKISCNTKEIFSNYSFKSSEFNIKKLKNILIFGDFDNISQNMMNSLENVSTRLYNDINEIMFRLRELGFDTVFMTGSGSSIVALYQNDVDILNKVELLASDCFVDKIFLSEIVRKK